MLKIGFDAKRIVRNCTGLGNYGRTLVNDLAGHNDLDLRLYTPDLGRDDLRSQVMERENVHYVLPLRAKNKLSKALWRSRGINRQLVADKVDLYHGLSGELPAGIRKSGIRSVVTIHDLIFLRHPEYYHWWDVEIYRRKFHQTLRDADRIVAISECTRHDISELGGIPTERIDLIYQSCAPRFSVGTDAADLGRVSQKYGLPENYILGVGSIEERKNMLLALKALPLLDNDIHLILVGRPTPYTEKIKRWAKENRLENRLHLLHGVPDADLPAIYAGAKIFVYPSRYEGFGIPIIEAVNMRLPVVACTGSCLEEAGGPHNIYVEPDDIQGMAEAVKTWLGNTEERQRRIELSRQYIRRFANNNCAEQFYNLYLEMTK